MAIVNLNIFLLYLEKMFKDLDIKIAHENNQTSGSLKDNLKEKAVLKISRYMQKKFLLLRKVSWSKSKSKYSTL